MLSHTLPLPRLLALSGLAVALAAPFGARPLIAQVAVRGVILEHGTGQPILNVELRLMDSAGQVGAASLTNEEGEFRLEASDAGAYSLSIRRIGYGPLRTQTFELADRDELGLEVTLNPEAVAMDAVTVVAERPIAPWLREVRRRTETNRRMGVGRVFLREDIDRIRPHSVSDLLSTYTFAARCAPTVLLDGLETEARDIVHNADMLEAVEIYRGPTQVPIEYYQYAQCGVALVWTRPDPPGAKPLTWTRIIAAGVLVGVAALLVQ